MKNWIKKIVVVMAVLCQSVAFAQSDKIAMAGTFRAEGKIYVVVAVSLILLAGIFVYLFRIEKKLKNLQED
ncbi:MAG: CcmD family protein [Cyclobacteriaceae bacterium]